MEDIVLLGIGGHAHSVVDSIEKAGKYRIVGFLDKESKQKMTYRNYKVIGTDDNLENVFRKGVRNAFITVGYLGEGNIRNRIYSILKNVGFNIPNIIDISAMIATDTEIGEGAFIGKSAIVNANSVIGDMCIINTGAVVEHDCVVEEFSHVAVGAVLCGDVKIGENTFIGANATVLQGIKIGENTIIGAGKVVTHNIRANMLVYGNVEKQRKR